MEKQFKEFIAYKGPCYTVEWYHDDRGRNEVLEYFNDLSVERQRKFMVLIRRIGDAGKIFDKTKFRNEGDGIYAFKLHPDRFLCFFFSGRKIIITNAFEKKTDKLPMSEKQKALIRQADFKRRIKEGTYYGRL
ncbi:MAG: type II toxin-antitoxin system RelE/ParE family toxin [Candidatus Omnitrophota bacterium]